MRASAVDKALRRTFDLSMTRTGRSRLVAPPRMARHRDGLMPRCQGWRGAAAHAQEQDVPSVECAKDGIAFDQFAQRLCALASPTNGAATRALVNVQFNLHSPVHPILCQFLHLSNNKPDQTPRNLL